MANGNDFGAARLLINDDRNVGDRIPPARFCEVLVQHFLINQGVVPTPFLRTDVKLVSYR